MRVLDAIGGSPVCHRAAHRTGCLASRRGTRQRRRHPRAGAAAGRATSSAGSTRRAYAHALLRGVTPQQRWGIPRALERHGWTVELKGGWRRKLVHQGVVARRDGRRVVLAILTDDSPTHEYGRATLEALARRLLTSAR